MHESSQFSVSLYVRITYGILSRFSPWEDHILMSLNVPIFILNKHCCLREKASPTWPIEIVLCVTPPLKSFLLWGHASICDLVLIVLHRHTQMHTYMYVGEVENIVL